VCADETGVRGFQPKVSSIYQPVWARGFKVMNKFSFLLVVVFSFGLLGNAVADIDSGLVAYYQLNGNANDSSGNNLNGVGTNISYTTEVQGSSATFSGNSYITVASNSNLQNLSQVTISMWVRLQDLNNKQRLIAHWTSGDNDGQSFVISVNSSNDTLGFIVQTTNAVSSSISTPVVSSNVWYHVVAVYNGNTALIYLNGNLSASEQISGTIDNRTGSLYIGQGGSSSFPNNLLDGQLDEVRIYNRALSSSEIQDLYQGSTSCTSTGFATVNSDLDIHIPSATFGSSNIWIDLQYKGASGFEHLWKLKDYGAN